MKNVKAPFKWLISGFSGKTSWEWLELLIVPVGLAIGAFYLESQVERRQERIATTRYEQEAQIADARAKQETLDNYLEKMQGLLLDRDLRSADEDSEVRSVARAITTTAIRELGSDHNALLISFLQESELIQQVENTKEKTTALLVNLDLSGANLSGVNLFGANLFDINLSSANLSDTRLSSTILLDADLSSANLSEANLNGANLSSANLDGASLNSANLNRANLSDARLPNADLRGANLFETTLRNAALYNTNLSGALVFHTILSDVDLRDADLSGAFLSDTNLRDADLSGADLSEAFLHGVDLSGTDLSRAFLLGADLSGTDLSEAQGLTMEQLSEARLCGTTLPEGIELNSDRGCSE